MGRKIVIASAVQSGLPAVSHGSDLTEAHVGYSALGVAQGGLHTTATPGRGYFRTDTPLEFVPNEEYIPSDDPANHGGIIPSGGLTIDGFDYPAGTYVCQFMDFSGQDFYCSGSNMVLFRGCRGRGTSASVGFWNCAVGHSGYIAAHFCDLGGLGAASGNYHEIPMKILDAVGARAYRNRIRYCTTGFQFNCANGEIIENYITDLTTFGTDAHLNGCTHNGGESCSMVLRNYIVVDTLDAEGRTVNQTDCISYFQDFGEFPGTGTNSDGSTGYKVADNYVGGTGYCIYAGKNAGSPSDSVNNMVLTGNLVTTASYANGGANGPIAAEPSWGSLGNAANDNRWADGANVGELAFGSA